MVHKTKGISKPKWKQIVEFLKKVEKEAEEKGEYVFKTAWDYWSEHLPLPVNVRDAFNLEKKEERGKLPRYGFVFWKKGRIYIGNVNKKGKFRMRRVA